MDTKLFGRNQPGGLFSIIDRSVFPTGNIWWVDSTNTTAGADAAGYGANPDAPFLTWVYAISAASAGDTIYLMPGHAETVGVTGAAAVTLSKARLKTIGLGGRTKKPQILIDAYADTYISITAADTVLQNICFSSGHADVASGIVVAAAGVEILGCEFRENTTAENFLVTILTTNAADNLLIDGCTFYGVTQATECIEIVGACNSVTITNNYIGGLFSVSAISATTAACLNTQIHNNKIYNATTAGNDLAGCIDLVASSTGMVTGNLVYLGDDTDCLTAIDAANCGRANNMAANEFAEEAGVAGAQST
jgi:hypothetical protein